MILTAGNSLWQSLAVFMATPRRIGSSPTRQGSLPATTCHSGTNGGGGGTNLGDANVCPTGEKCASCCPGYYIVNCEVNDSICGTMIYTFFLSNGFWSTPCCQGTPGPESNGNGTFGDSHSPNSCPGDPDFPPTAAGNPGGNNDQDKINLSALCCTESSGIFAVTLSCYFGTLNWTATAFSDGCPSDLIFTPAVVPNPPAGHTVTGGAVTFTCMTLP